MSQIEDLTQKKLCKLCCSGAFIGSVCQEVQRSNVRMQKHCLEAWGHEFPASKQQKKQTKGQQTAGFLSSMNTLQQLALLCELMWSIFHICLHWCVWGVYSGKCSKGQLHPVLIIKRGHDRPSTRGEPRSWDVEACQGLRTSNWPRRPLKLNWSYLILTGYMTQELTERLCQCTSEISSSEDCRVWWSAAAQSRNSSIRSFQVVVISKYVGT